MSYTRPSLRTRNEISAAILAALEQEITLLEEAHQLSGSKSNKNNKVAIDIANDDSESRAAVKNKYNRYMALLEKLVDYYKHKKTTLAQKQAILMILKREFALQEEAQWRDDDERDDTVKIDHAMGQLRIEQDIGAFDYLGNTATDVHFCKKYDVTGGRDQFPQWIEIMENRIPNFLQQGNYEFSAILKREYASFTPDQSAALIQALFPGKVTNVQEEVTDVQQEIDAVVKKARAFIAERQRDSVEQINNLINDLEVAKNSDAKKLLLSKLKAETARHVHQVKQEQLNRQFRNEITIWTPKNIGQVFREYIKNIIRESAYDFDECADVLREQQRVQENAAIQARIVTVINHIRTKCLPEFLSGILNDTVRSRAGVRLFNKDELVQAVQQFTGNKSKEMPKRIDQQLWEYLLGRAQAARAIEEFLPLNPSASSPALNLTAANESAGGGEKTREKLNASYAIYAAPHADNRQANPFTFKLFIIPNKKSWIDWFDEPIVKIGLVAATMVVTAAVVAATGGAGLILPALFIGLPLIIETTAAVAVAGWLAFLVVAAATHIRSILKEDGPVVAPKQQEAVSQQQTTQQTQRQSRTTGRLLLGEFYVNKPAAEIKRMTAKAGAGRSVDGDLQPQQQQQQEQQLQVNMPPAAAPNENMKKADDEELARLASASRRLPVKVYL
ncbi:MAG TPA: hypothetical protein VHZ76_01605 [Gammaproteobacteria bacterium]|jgi:hypothetical protein|nr:hypothetical protein [Gammaproteobacteria bacterium]